MSIFKTIANRLFRSAPAQPDQNVDVNSAPKLAAQAIEAQPIFPKRHLDAEPWYIDEVIDLKNSTVQIRGWAMQDVNIAPDQHAHRFSVNGKAPLTIDYPQARPDVQKVFWQRANAEMCGFTLTAPLEFPAGVIEVRCKSSLNSKASSGCESWYLPNIELHRNMPDADRRFRVIGNRDEDGFLKLGATDAMRLKSAYENAAGRLWADATAVLDWGVGCGRVARHLTPMLGERFFGCDIDSDNIAWCQQNLTGTFKVSTLAPPLPFDDNSFDVIYGVSVFTHLRAEWEHKWLQELHRVLKPGGVLMVTVHGQTAVDFANLDPETYAALTKRIEVEGLAITGPNNQLDGFVPHPEEYLNVYHAKDYIQKVWGQFYKDIQQLPGYIFTHDLVVATKK